MNEHVPNQQIENIGPDPAELVKRVSQLLCGEYTLEEIDGTFEIDSDELRLSFTQDDDLFEIRNIEVLVNGLGGRVMSQIHGYADRNRLSVIASNVKDTARGFWEKMGYEEGVEAGEFVRNI